MKMFECNLSNSSGSANKNSACAANMVPKPMHLCCWRGSASNEQSCPQVLSRAPLSVVVGCSQWPKPCIFSHFGLRLSKAQQEERSRTYLRTLCGQRVEEGVRAACTKVRPRCVVLLRLACACAEAIFAHMELTPRSLVKQVESESERE